MKVLCVGDVVGRLGCDMLFKYIEDLKYASGIDFVIVNGENSCNGRGISRSDYCDIKRAGADVITTGNHVWGNKDIIRLMEEEGDIVRPANLQKGVPGSGSVVVQAYNGIKVGVINLMGQLDMISCNSPFEAADAEIERIKDKTDIIFVDFHAEATSEKIAMGYYLDGRVSALFGTHTHVQTADDKILQNGTGYISDLGMTGPADSVLGINKTIILKRYLTGMPQKFEVANGRGQFCGCIFEIDETVGKCINTERIYFE